MIGVDGSRARTAPAQTDAEGWFSRERSLVLVLAAATVLALYLCFAMARPFLPALAWALALAVVARPLHDWLGARISNPNLAAGAAVILVGVALLLPTLFLAHYLTREGGSRVAQIRDQMSHGQWRETLQEYPTVAEGVAWIEANVDVYGEVQRAIASVAGEAASLVTGSVWAFVELLITLFALFYFFRDRRVALRWLRSLVPLSDPEADQVFTRVADSIHATIYGTLLVALIQGALGGLMFWWLGLPAPVLWGVVMALLAVVPWLGAFIVWLPAALFLALSGAWGKALILAAWGTIVVGLIDNLLYPVFVGNRLRLHTLLVFFAIVGGLAVFGASGVVLGPIILAVTAALVDIWRRRTAGGRVAEEGIHT